MSELILVPVSVVTPTVNVENRTYPRRTRVRYRAITSLPSVDVRVEAAPWLSVTTINKKRSVPFATKRGFALLMGRPSVTLITAAVSPRPFGLLNRIRLDRARLSPPKLVLLRPSRLSRPGR
jgi:hypothetical protein